MNNEWIFNVQFLFDYWQIRTTKLLLLCHVLATTYTFVNTYFLVYVIDWKSRLLGDELSYRTRSYFINTNLAKDSASERGPKEVETRWENNTAVRECWRNDATSYRLKRLPMWFLWAFSYQKQHHRRYNLQHICLFSDIRLLTYFSPLLYIYPHIRLNVI